jgi:hypothetical protein
MRKKQLQRKEGMKGEREKGKESMREREREREMGGGGSGKERGKETFLKSKTP